MATSRIACDCPVLPLPSLRHERVEIARVETGRETRLVGHVLHLDVSTLDCRSERDVVAVAIDVIPPDGRTVACDSILDVAPIAVKVEGGIGSGRTRVASGLALVVTGREERGVQAGEFGASAGVLAERIHPNAPGAPDREDWLIRVAVTLRDGSAKERRGPLAAHRVADLVAERVRRALREAPDAPIDSAAEWTEARRPQGVRVLLAKMVMGQGAMHEKLLFPSEPAGIMGGRSIIELGQGPVMLRVNELRDGAIHSLCCVSPSTKETTLHHFRDPLVERLADDPTIDLLGIAVFGSPAAEIDKRFVAERLATIASTVAPDGVIVATEGFGNNHIDWAHAIAQILKHGTPTVGVTWAGSQGRLVVGNEYLVALIDTNQSADGRETLRLGENTATPEVAARAVTMLRSFAAGIDIQPAPSSWDPTVITANQRLVAEAGPTGLCDTLRSEIPVPHLVTPRLTPLRVRLSEARVALVSAAGPFRRGDQPFREAGDTSYREIPADDQAAAITFGVGSYDHSDVNRDPNVMLPIERLRELVLSGEIGATTAVHLGFNGGGGDLERLRDGLAPQLLEQLRAMRADAVVLTGG
jgi:D-proline reductase (dithiol) PrdA